MSERITLPEDLNLIGYCGIDCSQCLGYKMNISEAAKNLRRELRKEGMKKIWSEIPILGEYEPFKKSLDGLAMLRCPKGCRGNGGNPFCKIRKCCMKKGYWSCGECELLEDCKKIEYITKNYNQKNIKILKKLKVSK